MPHNQDTQKLSETWSLIWVCGAIFPVPHLSAMVQPTAEQNKDTNATLVASYDVARNSTNLC